MSSSNMLEIVQGLAQAAANAYDGAHDKRFSHDGEERKVGLRREEGCAIMDSRVIDGFKVNFSGDTMCISYQSDIKLKEVYAGGFEQGWYAESITTDISSGSILEFIEKENKWFNYIKGNNSIIDTGNFSFQGLGTVSHTIEE